MSEITSAFTKGMKAGMLDGEVDESIRSLKLRFTDRELDSICLMMWHSERMQSIRDRLDKLEKVK